MGDDSKDTFWEVCISTWEIVAIFYGGSSSPTGASDRMSKMNAMNRSEGLREAMYVGETERRAFPIFYSWLVGTQVYNANFESENERWEYKRMNDKIKDDIAKVNFDYNTGNIDMKEKKRKLKTEWCELVNEFINKYGKKMVTNDIRSALNSVEENVGLDVTSWDGCDLACDGLPDSPDLMVWSTG